jgi:hypothetical protein
MEHREREVKVGDGMQSPLVFQMSGDFQLAVLEKLGMVEAKIDMIVGNGQPGRLRQAEDRITALEANDIKRNVYDRIVTAVIAFAVSAVIALHDYLGFK